MNVKTFMTFNQPPEQLSKPIYRLRAYSCVNIENTTSATGTAPSRRAMLQALGKRGAYFGCAPVWMIVPTCSPRSAAVSRPGTRPFTTCTRSR